MADLLNRRFKKNTLRSYSGQLERYRQWEAQHSQITSETERFVLFVQEWHDAGKCGATLRGLLAAIENEKLGMDTGTGTQKEEEEHWTRQAWVQALVKGATKREGKDLKERGVKPRFPLSEACVRIVQQSAVPGLCNWVGDAGGPVCMGWDASK